MAVQYNFKLKTKLVKLYIHSVIHAHPHFAFNNELFQIIIFRISKYAHISTQG